MRISNLLCSACFAVLTTAAAAQIASAQAAAVAPAADGPYKIIAKEKVGGAGGSDYIYADSDGRKIYIARSAGRGGRGGRRGGAPAADAGGAAPAPAPAAAPGAATNRVDVYDIETLKLIGSVPTGRGGAHGAAVDPKSGHGFCSSNPVVMWDTKTLAPIKNIQLNGNPDGLLFDPGSGNVFIFSHSTPNCTAINAADGTIVKEFDLGGAPEQAQSDGNGKMYVDLEDKDSVAVVDTKTLAVTATYPVGDKGGGPGGLGFDAKNGVLFVMCQDPHTCVIMSAADGKVLDALPIGAGTDGGGFNPNTMEAFSSNGQDGTLTIIKENSPTSFAVEQDLKTMPGAKVCTLDKKTDRILMFATEMLAPAAPSAAPPAAAPDAGGAAPTARRGGRGGRGGRGRGTPAPDGFTIFAAGK